MVPRVAVAALFLFASSLAAAAEDPPAPAPAALRPGDTASSALPPAATRTIAFEALAGTRCSLSLRRVGKAIAGPTVQVVAADGRRVDVRKLVRETRGSTTVRNLPVDVTGTWRADVRVPPGLGGTFVATVAAKTPRSLTLGGATSDAAAPAVATFDALSGARADVDVSFSGQRTAEVRVRLVAPDGTELRQSVGRGRARVRGVVVPSVGPVGVEVSGAAGKFAVRVRIAPPKGRRTLTVDDVEPLPVVTGVSPRDVENDGVRAFLVDGFGFTDRHRVFLRNGPAGPPAAVPATLEDGSGAVTFDLDDVPAGTYSMFVLLPGRSVTVPGDVVVRNRPAAFARLDPAEAPSDVAFDLRVLGNGLDPGTTFDLRRSSDGRLLPLGPVTRVDPRSASGRVAADAFTVGTYDLTIHEGGGATIVRPAAFDLLGRRGPGAALTTRDVHGSFYRLHDVAVDPAGARAVFATTELSGAQQPRAAFVFVDTATWTVLGTTRPPQFVPNRSTQWTPRVRFHPTDRTWALAWLDWDRSAATLGVRTLLRVTEAGDLGAVRSEQVVTWNDFGECPDPVPDVAGGGWQVVWSDGHSGRPAIPPRNRLGLRRLLSDGSAVANANRVLEDDPAVSYFFGVGGQRPDARFVVAYAASDGYLRYRVLEPDGAIGPFGPRTVDGFTVPQAGYATQANLAVSPLDGTALVTFGFAVGDGPGAFTRMSGLAVLVPGDDSAAPPARPVAADGVWDVLRDFAAEFRVVWNPTREEFVVAYTSSDFASVVLRVGTDGVVRPHPVRQAYAGVGATPFSWPDADTLHLARIVDPSDDGVHNPDVPGLTLHAMPIR